jgi:hypothetical protein
MKVLMTVGTGFGGLILIDRPRGGSYTGTTSKKSKGVP